jgi:hypothetical protein
MSWIGAGAGRDCFKLKDHDLCVKWFFEVDIEDWKSLHPNELAGYQKYRHTPVGVHLPMVHATCKQEVFDNWQKLMPVDCILVDFVGDSLNSILQAHNLRWNEASVSCHVLRKLFLAMMVMCINASSSNLEWHEDFHTGNLCFHKETKRWYLIDLEVFKETSVTFETAVHRAAERQVGEISGICKGPKEMWPAYLSWDSLLKEHMMNKHHEHINLNDVATKLQVQLEPIQAGLISLYLSSGSLQFASLCRKASCHPAEQGRATQEPVTLAFSRTTVM